MAIDFSLVSAAFEPDGVAVALLAIGALLMVPKVVKWGANKVLSMVDDDPHAGGYSERGADGVLRHFDGQGNEEDW